MKYSNIAEFIEFVINQFEGVEFIHEYNDSDEMHLFKLKDPQIYRSEAFQKIEMEAVFYFLRKKMIAVLFVDPEDDLIQFSNFEIYNQLEANSNQDKSQLLVLQGDNCFLEAAVDCNNECTSAA
ncbi:hypothetical protein [Saprospira grandis]|uniref:Uncharacterized protein n=1 Tax=Saprospira grandis (strain Lewin) TaxID=984262 RepID=H6KZE2_SAPGL|nr:hypothetical protein [Saprospira grandis]AFC24532.1 hypothetical protein SGRA_1797 [Saprospira grandis str. Lewin]